LLSIKPHPHEIEWFGHGHANALDVRAFKLSNGAAIELTDASVAKPLREKLRQSACARFSTVLGNGADAYHDSHVHLDLIERSNTASENAPPHPP
jgi:hypothetical protein